MEISKQELIDLEDCPAGLKRFIKQTSNTEESVKVVSLVGMGGVTTCDLLWLAGNKLPKEKIVKFVCDCALLNIELIKPYTDKYDLIVEFLKNPTDDAHAAALDAIDAARGYDAIGYAYAANAAAYTAAFVYHSDYAYIYASDVADYVISSGISKEEINKLLVKLFS